MINAEEASRKYADDQIKAVTERFNDDYVSLLSDAINFLMEIYSKNWTPIHIDDDFEETDSYDEWKQILSIKDKMQRAVELSNFIPCSIRTFMDWKLDKYVPHKCVDHYHLETLFEESYCVLNNVDLSPFMIVERYGSREGQLVVNSSAIRSVIDTASFILENSKELNLETDCESGYMDYIYKLA